MALVGALIGLPSFVEIGLVLPMPVIFLVSRRSGLFVLLPAWSSERSSSKGSLGCARLRYSARPFPLREQVPR